MDHYSIFGIQKTASQSEINKIYKELVKRWHPDHCEDKEYAHQKLADINKTYSVLSNTAERKKYDESLEKQQMVRPSYAMNQKRPPPKMFTTSDDESSMDIHKFRRQLRELNDEMIKNGIYVEGGGFDDHHPSDDDEILDTPYRIKLYEILHGNSQKNKGAPLHFDLYLSLEDLHVARDRMITVHRRTSQFNYEPHTFVIAIKRTMQDGDEITVDYAGHQIDEYGVLTRESGNCIIHVHVVTHDIYQKIDGDLHATFEISLSEAKNGFQKQIKDLDGKQHEINVKQLTKSNQLYVLRDKGIKKFDGLRGDIYVHFAVNLNDSKIKNANKPLKRTNPKRKKIKQSNVTMRKAEFRRTSKRDESSDTNYDSDNSINTELSLSSSYLRN
jgi:curved DNA-binding protein